MAKKALILKGGWDGHEPELTSKRVGGMLEEAGFEVTISDTLDVLADLDYLMGDGVSADIRYALTNSLGFGGHNASLLLRRYED